MRRHLYQGAHDYGRIAVALRDVLSSAIVRAAGTLVPTPADAARLWRDERMLESARAIVGLGLDVLSVVVSFLRLFTAIRAENLVLRRQLSRYIERGITPDVWIT
jgi:hypothetical protein